MSEASAPKAAVRHTTVDSELRDLTVVCGGSTIVGLYFPHHWYRPDPAGFGAPSDCGFDGIHAQIGEYLAGERQEFEVPVATSSDPRQERLWELVRQIPYAETAPYGDLAAGSGTARPPKRSAPRQAVTRSVSEGPHVSADRGVYET